MIERGKFSSLTLVNWNGFFIRTFDLDSTVTTLSGGNGAGKSTVLAAFVTALIPDLGLLHFRNTTDVGASHGGRDKGLYGKLQPGICYAVVEAVNSRKQRIMMGVRLQQLSGREHKIDLKSFILQDLPEGILPADLLTENFAGNQVRVSHLAKIKAQAEALEGVVFRQFPSIVEYHAVLFDLGILSKRLSSPGERSKFYRLLEASLYGGISAAITKSLRDYLLPENSGVRKAFKDMEAALRENRITLEAIRLTQSDRDLFKKLIGQATSYVSADYMRHLNQRRVHLQNTLDLRQLLRELRGQLSQLRGNRLRLTEQLGRQGEHERELEIAHQEAQFQLHQINSAMQSQAKMDRYQNELDELQVQSQKRLDEVSEASWQLAQVESSLAAAEEELDQIKSQLADHQLALDMQQTMAVQYQQAQQALEKAKRICRLPDLRPEEAQRWQQRLADEERQATDKLLNLEQRLKLLDAASQKFDRAYRVVCQIVGPVERHLAWQAACNLLQELPRTSHLAANLEQLQNQYAATLQRWQQQQRGRSLLDDYYRRYGTIYGPEQLVTEQRRQVKLVETITESITTTRACCSKLIQERASLDRALEQQISRLPAWSASRRALERLSQQCAVELKNPQMVSEQMQSALEKQQTASSSRNELATRRQLLAQQLESLQQPGSGGGDSRLSAIAERLGGTVLAEIYDDLPLEDAPYFSALYGPEREAIVVPNLASAREQLAVLTECPDDLHLIEGNPDSFDATLFDVSEQEKALLVTLSKRRLRYSRFPSTPMFGGVARERQVEKLRIELQSVEEQYAAISFEMQKWQRIYQLFSEFISQHMSIAFEESPEHQVVQLNSKLRESAQLLRQQQQIEQEQLVERGRAQETLEQLNHLLPLLPLLSEDGLAGEIQEQKEAILGAEKAQQFLQRHATALKELNDLLPVLQSDPEQYLSLKEELSLARDSQKLLGSQLFALTEVIQRLPHFGYTEDVAGLSDLSSIDRRLQQKIMQGDEQRSRLRQECHQGRQRLAESNQGLAVVESAALLKQELVADLQKELAATEIVCHPKSIVEGEERCAHLQELLGESRNVVTQTELEIVRGDAKIEQIGAKITHLDEEYRQKRSQAVLAKIGWSKVLHLAREQRLTTQLYRAEFAHYTLEELRSLSDKALGALRQSVADHEGLRDSLRLSEDSKSPLAKVQFYLAVSQYLRQRIRQDILCTDNPIEAIEQMEVELARLTEELSARESLLTISSKSVANIIRKTIQREQNRIHLLNQGLQSLSFGQVSGVRLTVGLREGHALLLDTLADQHSEHQALLADRQSTFSETLAKLYRRLIPQMDLPQSSTQTIGDSLLDYRHYLTLEVEVLRGSDGWLRAESGALSTGEAIGTGMAILLMVVQSWEEESARLRSKDILPSRLLFLDEAARLDGHSINTLFELCERLQMQLLIAAPENISPERGTTYKLMRKIVQKREHVHVIGLSGFGAHKLDMSLNNQSMEEGASLLAGI